MATDEPTTPPDRSIDPTLPPGDSTDRVAPPDHGKWDDPPIAPRPILDDTERRDYIEIRLGTTPLDHGAVRAAMVRLAGTLRGAMNDGILAMLTRSTVYPRIEFLLVSDGQADAELRYLVGASEEIFDSVWDICRTALPNDYELKTVRFHPLELEWCCTPPSPPPRVSFTERVASDERDDDGADGDTAADGAGEDTTEDDGLWQFGPAHTPRRSVETEPTNPDTDDVEPERWTQIGDGVPYVAGVEYLGVTRRRQDWQTPLRPFRELTSDTRHRTDRRVPLATVAEALANAPVPAVYQALIGPYYDWSSSADMYVRTLSDGTDSTFGQVWEVLSPRTREDRQAYEPDLAAQRRIDAISERSARHSAIVVSRAVALTHTDPDAADRLATRLKTAFESVAGEYHEVRGRVATDGDRGQIGDALGYLPTRSVLRPGQRLYADLLNVVLYGTTYHKRRGSLPLVTPQSKAAIVDPAELPHFCLLGGAELPPGSKRALETRRSERTGVALPPPGTLNRYDGDGWPLGRPLDADRQIRLDPVCLPPALQTLHMLIVGASGAGKSTTLGTGLLANHELTDGLSILLDAKGGGMATDYLRAHYAKYGHLDDVIYINCAEALPAIGMFDIRLLLEAGVAREEARSRVTGHYQEILQGIMGGERFGRAVQSPKVIRNHLKALFDPVHGDDAVSHDDLVTALRRTQQNREAPAVTDEALAGHFESILASEPRVFSQVMGGALARVETIATDGRLAPLFDHVPAVRTREGRGVGEKENPTVGQEVQGSTDEEREDDERFDDPTEPSFSFTDLLDDDRVVIIDFGGMEESVKQTLTLVLLSKLWTALKARAEREQSEIDRSLVNLYLEDAGSVANTKLVDTLLSQGRSFGLSVTMGVQYPGQLETTDPARDTYREVLNETATMLVGNVSVDRELTNALATDDLPPDRLARRLASLSRGEWLCRPAAGFGEEPPRPFLVESLPPPPGHPASDQPLTNPAAFEHAFNACREDSRRRYGLPQTEVRAVDEAASDDESGENGGDQRDEPAHRKRSSCLPHTQRLPSCLQYNGHAHALVCTACDARYDPTDEGMARAISCCHDITDVDPDDIPITTLNLKRSAADVAGSEWSLTQLLFVQAVYNAQQGRYEAPGYDIVHDSMIRLREYVGISPDAVVDLIDAGVITQDGDHPHRLYSVTSEGRDVIGEVHREGVDFGDGTGDMTESSQHRLMVEVGRRYIEQAFVDEADSRVVRAKPYHEITVDGETKRLDCAGLDEDGDVVVTLEAERINHDVNEAVPEDFDKMAACDPEEAIWVVLGRADGHRVLDALVDPPDGEPRVEKTYSTSTPFRDVHIDTPGFSQIHSVRDLRDEG